MHRAIGTRAIKDPRGIREILEFRGTHLPSHDTHSCMPVTRTGNCIPREEERKRKREREREREREGGRGRGRDMQRRTSEWVVPGYCKEPWVLYALRVVNSTELRCFLRHGGPTSSGRRGRGRVWGSSGPVHAEDALILMYRDLLRHGCSSPVGRMYVYKYVSQRGAPSAAPASCAPASGRRARGSRRRRLVGGSGERTNLEHSRPADPSWLPTRLVPRNGYDGR